MPHENIDKRLPSHGRKRKKRKHPVLPTSRIGVIVAKTAEIKKARAKAVVTRATAKRVKAHNILRAKRRPAHGKKN